MKVDRIRVLSKYGGHCAYCGCFIQNETMQVDHVVPQRNFEGYFSHKDSFIDCGWIPKFLSHLSVDDVNHYDNLFPSCRKCNHYKSTLTIEKFRNELSLQLERLQKNTNFVLAKKYGQIETTPTRIIFYFEQWNKTY